MGTFTNAIIREIGRNYGKAISNSLLGDKHANPVKIVSSQRVLCAGTGGRNYPNKLEKLLATYEIKGATATGRTKPAQLVTGLELQVPEYLEPGEVIRIHTSNGKFISRA